MTNEEAIKHITTWLYAAPDLPPMQVVQALELAVTALRAGGKDKDVPTMPAEQPLTLEQLREMDGEPVWIANPDALGYGRWGIVDGVYQAEDDQVLMLRGDYSCHYYGKTWLAYRRPPEGAQ